MSIEVGLALPSLEQHCPSRIHRVGGDHVLDAAALGARSPHGLDPFGEERVPLVRVDSDPTSSMINAPTSGYHLARWSR